MAGQQVSQSCEPILSSAMPIASFVFFAKYRQCPLCERVNVPTGAFSAHVDQCRREREEGTCIYI